ncbi:hypothetical protein Tco_0207048 [Tanacetum coccineum]
MTESPFVDLGFAVPVFSPGDDPIAYLNKAMAFLTVVASLRFPTTNNQLRTSSNLRNQGTIQDGRVTERTKTKGQNDKPDREWEKAVKEKANRQKSHKVKVNSTKVKTNSSNTGSRNFEEYYWLQCLNPSDGGKARLVY